MHTSSPAVAKQKPGSRLCCGVSVNVASSKLDFDDGHYVHRVRFGWNQWLRSERRMFQSKYPACGFRSTVSCTRHSLARHPYVPCGLNGRSKVKLPLTRNWKRRRISLALPNRKGRCTIRIVFDRCSPKTPSPVAGCMFAVLMLDG